MFVVAPIDAAEQLTRVFIKCPKLFAMMTNAKKPTKKKHWGKKWLYSLGLFDFSYLFVL